MSHAQAIIIIYATTICMYVHDVYVRMYVCAYVCICVHVCMCRCMCVRMCMHVAYWFEISSADQEVLGSVLNRCYYCSLSDNLTNIAPLHQAELDHEHPYHNPQGMSFAHRRMCSINTGHLCCAQAFQYWTAVTMKMAAVGYAVCLMCVAHRGGRYTGISS